MRKEKISNIINAKRFADQNNIPEELEDVLPLLIKQTDIEHLIEDPDCLVFNSREILSKGLDELNLEWKYFIVYSISELVNNEIGCKIKTELIRNTKLISELSKLVCPFSNKLTVLLIINKLQV